LEEKMKKFAKNLEFERAKTTKEQLDSIKILNEKQIIRDSIL
jgi:excinuclease UvrABC nuclease subunit